MPAEEGVQRIPIACLRWVKQVDGVVSVVRRFRSVGWVATCGRSYGSCSVFVWELFREVSAPFPGAHTRGAL